MAELVKVVCGVSVRARAADRYVNATDLCKAGGKKWAHFERNRETQEFLVALGSKVRIRTFDLIQKRCGSGGGTWVHPRLALRLCMWISAEFAAQVTGWIETLLSEGHVELPGVGPSVATGLPEVCPDDPLAGQIVALQQSLAIMLDTRQRQVAIERQQTELARQQAELLADAADTRALAVCAAQTARAALDQNENNHGYVTVRGFARLQGWEMPEREAGAHGKRLSALCRKRGIRIGDVKDERHGTIHSYPETLLREHFADRLGGADHESSGGLF